MVAAIVLAAVWTGAAIAWAALYWDRLAEACPAYDGEGTMAAPRSLQARVVCGADGSDLVAPGFYLPLLAAMGVLVLVAVLLWARRRPLPVVALLCVGVIGLPVVASEVALRLEDACSAEQWRRYGATGCEQDREAR
ncbi:hypothetical protein ACJ5H2_19140 [Nocardioides sp. R1-1]|uniref:hypothetical protein n=1 Tax=Nocardioides sp. R1-1 TaxID=3383502 RepID=UPI0038D2439D